MVYVDDFLTSFRGMRMSHMMADTLEELHEMADKLHLRRAWFQKHCSVPHYDICNANRIKAIEFGAIDMPRRINGRPNRQWLEVFKRLKRKNGAERSCE